MDLWPFESEINGLWYRVEDYYSSKFQAIPISGFRFIELTPTPTLTHSHHDKVVAISASPVASHASRPSQKFHWKLLDNFSCYPSIRQTDEGRNITLEEVITYTYTSARLQVIEEADVDDDDKLSYSEFQSIVSRAPNFAKYHLTILRGTVTNRLLLFPRPHHLRCSTHNNCKVTDVKLRLLLCSCYALSTAGAADEGTTVFC